MKFIYLLFIPVFVSGFLKAQHCGWESSYILILNIVDAESQEFIPDLDIYLCDSNGIPYKSEWNLINYQHTTLFQNTDSLKFGFNSGKKPPKFKTVIRFGVNRYMILLDHTIYPDFNSHYKDLICINDPQNNYNNTCFTYDPCKISNMCTSNAIWHDPDIVEKREVRIVLPLVQQ